MSLSDSVLSRFNRKTWPLLILLTLIVTLVSCGDDAKQLADNLRETADQGDSLSQYQLGLMYYNGKGVPKDLALAAQWLTKAAEQKYGMAQLNLGIMYHKGEGVPQDKVLSYQWILLAAAHLTPAAVNILDNIKADLSAEQRTKAEQLAQTWLTKHSTVPAQEWLASYLVAEQNKPATGAVPPSPTAASTAPPAISETKPASQPATAIATPPPSSSATVTTTNQPTEVQSPGGPPTSPSPPN